MFNFFGPFQIFEYSLNDGLIQTNLNFFKILNHLKFFEYNLNVMDECQVLHGSILKKASESVVEDQPFAVGQT